MGYQGGFPARIVGPGLSIVAGMFTTHGTTPQDVRGHGYSVARTATGRYTVTLDRAVNQFVSIVVSVAAETLTDEVTQVVVDQDSIDTDSFEIRLTTITDTSAAPSALDDDAGSQISFIAVVAASNLPDTAVAS